MMRGRLRLLAIAVLGLAFASPGAAEAQLPEALVGRSVAAIEVVTSSGPFDAESVVAPFVGRTLDRGLARELTSALIATERFADVQLEVDSDRTPLTIVARVALRLRIARIDVFGNRLFDDSEIRDRLGISVGDDIDRAAEPRMQATLESAYQERGYDEARVDVRLLDTDDDQTVVLEVELAEGDPTRIRAVNFGAATPPEWPSPLRSLQRLERDPMDHEKVERARTTALHRLREAGYLEAVIGDPVVTQVGPNVTLDIPLTLGPRYRLVVVGHEPLRAGQVLSAIELPDLTLDEAGLATARQHATDVFLRAGFLHATATIELDHDEETGEHAFVVTIDHGLPIRMRPVEFDGASHFTPRYLREQLETFLDQELRGAFGAPLDRELLDRAVGGRRSGELRRQPDPMYVPPEEIYYAPTFTRAIEHLTTLYREAGFMEASLGEPGVVALDEGTIRVSIAVHEGPRTLFDDVLVLGNAALDDRELAEALELERGAGFSEAALSAAVERVIARYRTRGFLYATVTQAVSFSRDRTLADVELTINERFPVHVGSVRIVGARQTHDSVIRSLVAMRTGDLFTSQAARRTEERLLEIGIFGSVVVAPSDAEVPEPTKDVVVTVSERLPQVLDFGAGISTGQGVRGSFEYSYRNLFGRAITLSLRAQLSGQFFFLDPVLEERFESLTLAQRLERRVSVGMALPTIGHNPDFRLSFNVLNLRDNTRTFGIDKTAFDITAAYRPSRRFSLSLSPSLERNDVQLLVRDQTYEELLMMSSGPTRQLLLVPQGKSTLFAIGAVMIVDRRNNAFSPTRGYYLSAGVEWARTLTAPTIDLSGMDVTFRSNHLRLTGGASTYVRIHGDVVLALQAKVGGIVHLRDYSNTFPNRQFFLGGVDTMRSYRQDAMIPQDVIDRVASTGVDPVALVQGGQISLLARTELRFPVFGSFSAAVFGEFGNLWADASNVQPWRLRPSIGLGLRLDTPVGPIALDYGFNVLYRQADRQAVGERIGAFNFSIGVF